MNIIERYSNFLIICIIITSLSMGQTGGPSSAQSASDPVLVVTSENISILPADKALTVDMELRNRSDTTLKEALVTAKVKDGEDGKDLATYHRRNYTVQPDKVRNISVTWVTPSDQGWYILEISCSKCEVPVQGHRFQVLEFATDSLVVEFKEDHVELPFLTSETDNITRVVEVIVRNRSDRILTNIDVLIFSEAGLLAKGNVPVLHPNMKKTLRKTVVFRPLTTKSLSALASTEVSPGLTLNRTSEPIPVKDMDVWALTPMIGLVVLVCIAIPVVLKVWSWATGKYGTAEKRELDIGKKEKKKDEEE